MAQAIITEGFGPNATIQGVISQGFLGASGSVATSYTFTGPSSGIKGQALTYTLTPNGTTTAIVTPATTDTGVFSPTTITLNNTSPVTFTYTPTVIGTATLSVSNNGSLSDPSSIVLSVTDGLQLLGGGPGTVYHSPYSKYREEEYQRKLKEHAAELKQVDKEIADAERRKQEELAELRAKRLARNAAKKIAATEAALQEQINVLRMERVRLMRLMQDEEAILVLLLSLPLH